MEVFQELTLLISEQNKYTNIKGFWTISRHKTRALSLQKVPKNPILSPMAITLW